MCGQGLFDSAVETGSRRLPAVNSNLIWRVSSSGIAGHGNTCTVSDGTTREATSEKAAADSGELTQAIVRQTSFGESDTRSRTVANCSVTGSASRSGRSPGGALNRDSVRRLRFRVPHAVLVGKDPHDPYFRVQAGRIAETPAVRHHHDRSRAA